MLSEEQALEKMFEMVEPLLDAEYDLELVEVQWRREPTGWVLRLFVDRKDGSGKVPLSLITSVSKHLSDFLDVEDVITTPYSLEVSSPGFDRPIRKPSHFVRYVGQKIRVKLKAGEGSKKQAKGTLVAADEERIKVKTGNEEEIVLKYEEIKNANLIYEWS